MNQLRYFFVPVPFNRFKCLLVCDRENKITVLVFLILQGLFLLIEYTVDLIIILVCNIWYPPLSALFLYFSFIAAWKKIKPFITSLRNHGGVIFSLQFVRVSVCLSVFLYVRLCLWTQFQPNGWTDLDAGFAKGLLSTLAWSYWNWWPWVKAKGQGQSG